MNEFNNENNDQGSKSLILDLESLRVKYKNLLIEYKQAVLNYVNYLKEDSLTPCGKYTLNSNNIDQECYNEIWKKGGCSTKARVLSSIPGSSSVTLYNWIKDTFNWATTNDYKNRMGCYGNFDSAYLIIGVGKYDGNLYWREGLNAIWKKVNDNSNGNILSISTGSDGKTIFGVNTDNQIIIKPSWDSTTWSEPISCSIGPPLYTQVKFLSIAQGPDGTLVGVGTDLTLWSAPALYNYFWTNVSTNTNGRESQIAVCIGPNGRLIVANGIDLYYKDSYKNLQNQVWKYGCPGCCQDITVAPDGKLIDAGGCPQYSDNQLWAIDSYLNLNGGWRGPYPSSCCIKSLTTVTNTKVSSEYSKATQPNYNVEQKLLVNIKGNTFWGENAISQNNTTTLQECSALCSNTEGCSGATFNPSDHGQPFCSLRSGEGEVMGGLPNDYAIVPKGKQLLKIVKDINQQLISINEKIQHNTNNGKPLYENQSIQRKYKMTQLINQFNDLVKERENVSNMINQYETLNNKQEDGSIKISQNYNFYFLLKCLVIILLIFLGLKYLNYLTQSNFSIFSFFIFLKEIDLNTYFLIFFTIILIILILFYNKLNFSFYLH
jgi:hypothetical protein